MRKGRPKILSTHLIVDRYVNLELFNNKQNELANGCWEWTGITNNAGYGFIGFIYADKTDRIRGHGMMTVHRLAWMVENDRLPTKRNINHTCHNRLCCNPKHLVEGTQQEKMQAMRDDGIKLGCPPKGPRGSYNHKQDREYKYSDDEIQWMRTAPIEDIMSKFDITQTIATRRQWAFRRGYAWLPCPEYERKKPGRPAKVTK